GFDGWFMIGWNGTGRLQADETDRRPLPTPKPRSRSRQSGVHSSRERVAIVRRGGGKRTVSPPDPGARRLANKQQGAHSAGRSRKKQVPRRSCPRCRCGRCHASDWQSPASFGEVEAALGTVREFVRAGGGGFHSSRVSIAKTFPPPADPGGSPRGRACGFFRETLRTPGHVLASPAGRVRRGDP